MVNKEKLTFSAFYERFSILPDNRIMDILRNHNDYQEAARNAATQIAIERGIIHSVEDLLAPEFQKRQSTKHTLFPSTSDEHHHNRLLSSVFRFLFVFSLLPVVYGILQYAKGNMLFATAGIILGSVWFLLTFYMKRSGKTVFVFPLLFLVLVVAIFFGYKLFVYSAFNFMDFFIFLIGVLLPAYFVLLARKLIGSK